jgi:glycosyltransferase involved in cell wall biosynthesis
VRIVVSASGRFHSLHLANQMRKHGSLYRLFSAGYNAKDTSYVPGILVSSNKTINFLDRAYIKFGLSRLMSPSAWYVVRDNLFDKWVAKQLSTIGRFDLFVGWAHCSLAAMRVAKKHGAKTVIESGSMHILAQEQILKEEYEKAGFFAPPIKNSNKVKMLQEYEEADRIAVPSEHVYKSFIESGIEKEKLIKVPYGVNVRSFALPRTGKPEKFRVIFVGQVGVQKGIHHLLEAWSALGFSAKEAELLIVGDLMHDGKKILKKYKNDASIVVKGPVAHKKLGDLYRSSTLFVLPSIQEGMAMVVGEAMASSLPVIATTKTGAAELIKNGEHGFIIEPGQVGALAQKILWCFKNSEECFQMGRNALARIQNFSWEHYGDSIFKEYLKVVDGYEFVKMVTEKQNTL